MANLKLKIALDSIADKITNGGTLRMGFLADAKYPAGKDIEHAGLHVAQVAFWNEFGTSRAPARPAFRTTIADNTKRWSDVLAATLPAVDYDGETALRTLGQVMRDDLENSIATWSTPGNAPSTIARKGFDKPLVDTGVMQRAPDFEVVK